MAMCSDNVAEQRSLVKALHESARIPSAAHVFVQRRHQGEQPVVEFRHIAGLDFLEILEIERHQHRRFMRKDVRTFKRPDVYNLHD